MPIDTLSSNANETVAAVASDLEVLLLLFLFPCFAADALAARSFVNFVEETASLCANKHGC
jgi:hypothetical protein